MLIRNGLIHDAIHETPYIADILLKDGKIAAIGQNLPNDDNEVFDASGLQVWPGLIDAHCHIGTNGFISTDGQDDNEHTSVVAPQLRILDAFNPQAPDISNALHAGITTVCVTPGSGEVIAGAAMAVKTFGECVDDMILREPVAMKIAFGQNPKARFEGKGSGTRMGVAYKLRETLHQAMDYMKKKEDAGDDASKLPKFDYGMEALIPVLKGEIPLKAHCHRADDICTAIRIAKEFGVKLTLEHVTQGHLIVDTIKRAEVPCAVGPSLIVSKKSECDGKTFATAGILSDAGIPVSIITDAPVSDITLLPICAGYAVKNGMNPFAALQGITIRAAEHIGVADRVGSLEVGKDGDVTITDGDIMSNLTRVQAVFLDGVRRV